MKVGKGETMGTQVNVLGRTQLRTHNACGRLTRATAAGNHNPHTTVSSMCLKPHTGTIKELMRQVREPQEEDLENLPVLQHHPL